MSLTWRQREVEGCAQRPPASGFHIEDCDVDSPGSVIVGLVKLVSQSAQDRRDQQRCPLWRDRERGGDSFEVNLPAAHSRRPGHARRQSHAVSGWPVASTAEEERPGSSAVWSALPSAACGAGGSKLSLTVELLGNLKGPTPSPQPQGFPVTKAGGPLAPEIFSEFPDGSRVGQLGEAPIRAFLEYVRRSLSQDCEGEQGSQPPENPDQAEPNKPCQLQAGSRLQGLGHLLQIGEGSPTPQTGRLRHLE